MATSHRDKPAPKFIPYKLAYAVAWVVERIMVLFRRRDYLVSADAMYLSNVFRELDNGKARRELHWNPRPLRETVKDAVDWFASKGLGTKPG